MDDYKPLTVVVKDLRISGFFDAAVSSASGKDYHRIEKSYNPQIEY